MQPPGLSCRRHSPPLVAGSAALAQKFDLDAIEHDRVLRAADRYLSEKPVTVTAVALPAQRRRPARFLFRGRLLGGPIPRIPTVRTSSATA